MESRETFYLSIAEPQRDLDAFMTHYNNQRSRQGYKLNGRRPAAAQQSALKLDQLPSLGFAAPTTEPTAKEETTVEATT